MIEEILESFRNRLVQKLVALLLYLHAWKYADALVRANSRFKCPVCRLIEAIRSKNLTHSRCWANFCVQLRRWSYCFCGADLIGIWIISVVQIFQSQLAFLAQQRIWLPHKPPIYLQKMVLRN
jgi:hypothetical protein